MTSLKWEVNRMEAKSWVGSVIAATGHTLRSGVTSRTSVALETEAMARSWVAGVLSENPDVDLSYGVRPSLADPVFFEESHDGWKEKTPGV